MSAIPGATLRSFWKRTPPLSIRAITETTFSVSRLVFPPALRGGPRYPEFQPAKFGI
jgi:hypothetical protein